MNSPKILIAAGGTGGHIYPALAMAEAFKKREPRIIVEFVGTPFGLENRIIPANGYRLHHLPVGRLNSNVRLTERIKTILFMPYSLVTSALTLRKFKPDLVLGVGGHASGPLLLVASMMGYPTAIWEPNAMPGLANRWLARFVDAAWVVFDEAKPFIRNLKLFDAGMPVRREIEDISTLTNANETRSSSFNILVFGGSQGARRINDAVLDMFRTSANADENSKKILRGLRLVHQTGSADFARVSEAYAKVPSASGAVEVRAYLEDMGAQYAKADLVVCRSGTGTLSELAACGKPAILIPLPTASDDHQRKNAESLVRKGGAVVLEQKDLTGQSLGKVVGELRADPERLKQMGAALRSFHRPQAADRLVSEMVEKFMDQRNASI